MSTALAPALDGLSGSMLGIATIVVGLRFYARSHQKAGYQADDYFMMAAFVFFIGMLTGVFCGTSYRTLGYSTAETTANPAPQYNQIIINRVTTCFASAYFGCVKASALFFFRRVFCIRGQRSALLITIWVLLITTLLWTILFILLPIFQCHTYIAAAWTPPAIRDKWCTISDGYIESQSVTSVVFDLLILVLPLPKIWSLQTTTQRRIATTLVFLTAAVALAASIARTVIVFEIYRGGIPIDLKLADSQVYFMWVLEAGFAMIAINAPTLVWLRSSKAPERMLSSVRSFLSINSNKKSLEAWGQRGASPTTVATSHSASRSKHTKTGVSQGSLGLVPDHHSEHRSFVVSNKDDLEANSLPEHGIQVTNAISQSYSAA